MSGLRPVWTPEDAAQTARDAAQHVAVPAAEPVDEYNRMFAELARWHLDPVYRPAPTQPARGRHQEPVRAGMRPRRALMIGRILVAAAVLVLVLTVGALWLAR